MSGGRLERVSQVGFIVMSLAVTAAAVQHMTTVRATPARSGPPAAVAAGTRLKLPPQATNDGRSPVLLAVLSSECRFCTESMPFYKRLAALPEIARGAITFNVVSVQPVEVMRGYLAQHGLTVSGILTAPDTGAYVRGTPSLILTDQHGVVTASWSGALPPAEERNVEAAITRLQQGGIR